MRRARRRSSSSRRSSRPTSGRRWITAIPIKTYNKHGVESAYKLAPEYDWKSYLTESGLPAGDFVIRQPSYATALGKHMHEADLAVWKDYLMVRTIGAYARVLPAAFVEASFDFNSRTLRGTEALRPRWKRAVQETDNAMGEAIGAAYVARHFPPEAKARMVTLVGNLLAEFDRGIDRLDWMSAATKTEAHAKLKKINVKIAYPDKWRDYTGLEIRPDDLVGNVMRANQFEWNWQAARAGKPKDPSEWFMTPQTVNAYYLPTNNEIVFPAAFLQPPYFNMQADDAANYGAIGSVIGHEISHGFDDRGRQYDGDGNLQGLVVAGGQRKIQVEGERARQAVLLVRGAARPQRQWRADARRKHRRPFGRRGRLRRIHPFAERRASAGHRRLHRAPALLPGLCAGLAHEVARRPHARGRPDGSACAERVPRERRRCEHG